MNTKPIVPTPTEIAEIAASTEIQELWGVKDIEEMKDILESDYVVKFDFINESPGYVGDLFVVQSSALSKEIPALRLIRDRSGELILVN